jgi:Fe-S cluster assembly scaffold protein SufB
LELKGLDSKLLRLLDNNLIVKLEIENEDPNPRIYWLGSGEQVKSVADELREQIEQVNQEIGKLTEEDSRIDDVGNYVDILHEYNDLKDTGQALLGQLATIEGTTTKEMYKRFKLELED